MRRETEIVATNLIRLAVIIIGSICVGRYFLSYEVGIATFCFVYLHFTFKADK